MSQELPSKTRKLLGIDVTVTGQSPKVDLDGYLWTFNRSNVRIRWMYDLYLRMATGLAYTIGARIYFMGYQSKCLRDDPEIARNIWLLIAYPTADHFLRLFVNPLFESMNLTIGNLSIKERLFGFSKRLDNGAMPSDHRTEYKGDKSYLIHYFKKPGDQPLAKHKQAINEAAVTQGTTVFFMGERVATLRVGSKAFSSPSDGAMIFEGPDETTLESLLAQPAYKAFLEETTSDYIAFYERRI